MAINGQEAAQVTNAPVKKKKRSYGLLAVGGFDMPFLILLLLVLSIGLICMFSASFVMDMKETSITVISILSGTFSLSKYLKFVFSNTFTRSSVLRR